MRTDETIYKRIVTHFEFPFPFRQTNFRGLTRNWLSACEKFFLPLRAFVTKRSILDLAATSITSSESSNLTSPTWYTGMALPSVRYLGFIRVPNCYMNTIFSESRVVFSMSVEWEKTDGGKFQGL